MSALRKIILVEDDEFDADMTMNTLRKTLLANPIVWLETGLDLIQYLDEQGTDDIAVVIMDLNMPKLSGIEALRLIRAGSYGHFPIVVLTSSQQNPDVQACYELGVNSFITKPVRRDEFQESVRSLGLYWGILNVLPEK
ncbi:MAG: response regulator [Bacteroidia bacterium]